MERNIGTDKLKDAIEALDKAAQKTGAKNLRVILCGGLAAIAYGINERVTLDIDAEIDADFGVIESLTRYITFPAELTTDISRWSMIDIPDGYRDRVLPFEKFNTKNIKVFLLSPLDLVISKLRVFRDKDIQDALFLVKKFHINKLGILKASKQSAMQSPPSTEILRFKKNIKYFLTLMD